MGHLNTQGLEWPGDSCRPQEQGCSRGLTRRAEEGSGEATRPRPAGSKHVGDLRLRRGCPEALCRLMPANQLQFPPLDPQTSPWPLPLSVPEPRPQVQVSSDQTLQCCSLNVKRQRVGRVGALEACVHHTTKIVHSPAACLTEDPPPRRRRCESQNTIKRNTLSIAGVPEEERGKEGSKLI